MMSCPIPMPVPIIPTALHSTDFSPIHIGVKNNKSQTSRQQMQLLQATPTAATAPYPHHLQQQQAQTAVAYQSYPTTGVAATTMLQHHQLQQQQHQQQAVAAAAAQQQQQQAAAAAAQQQQQYQLQQQYHFQQQQLHHHQQQQQQQQLQMLQTYMQLQMNNIAVAAAAGGHHTPGTPTKYATAAATPTLLQQQQQQAQFFTAPAATTVTPLTIIPTPVGACTNTNGSAAAVAAALFAAAATPLTSATSSSSTTTTSSNNVNNNIDLLSATSTTTTNSTTTTTPSSTTTSTLTPTAASEALNAANVAATTAPFVAATHKIKNSGYGILAAPTLTMARRHEYVGRFVPAGKFGSSGSNSSGGGNMRSISLLGNAATIGGGCGSGHGGNSSNSGDGSKFFDVATTVTTNAAAHPAAAAANASSSCNISMSSWSSASSDCSMPSPSTSLHLSSPKKRGSDELLSQAAIMAPASDNNNQDLATKKAKLDSSTVLGGVGKPSKVIHLRNIPNESSEPDVISLGVPFGRVTNVLVLKGKNQAFLEMADEVSATSMVSCYTVNPPQMRGRMVYVQFSNHRELKTDQSHASNAVVPADYRIQSPASGSPLPLCGTGATSNTDGTVAILQNNTNVVNSASGNSTAGGPNTVLRVIVESLLYPVSLDILHQIFQRFGKVLKIVTFTKNNSFQALIQYPDAHSAQHAKTILDGQNIYNGCCTLRIDNSKLTALNVKYNNDKSRDFTNPSLPPGEPGADIMPTAGGLVNANDLLLIAARQRPSLTGDKIVNGLGAPGVLPPFALGLGTPLAGGYNSGIPNLGAFALANSGALQTATPALRGFSNVLLVSNLNEEMVTPDALFTLFGVYGDVQRVKILYNKKDSALIQMAEPQQAYLALTHLDKLRLWGKPIRVMSSKHQAVQLPKEGQPDAGLTRDYSQNPLHRFKKPGSKNYQNIYPPSATLHLSNIPSSCTEEDIKEAFTTNNFEVKAFKFFPKDRKMALLQLSSVEEAVSALIKMHNHQLSESNHLRVSFSKSNI